MLQKFEARGVGAGKLFCVAPAISFGGGMRKGILEGDGGIYENDGKFDLYQREVVIGKV